MNSNVRAQRRAIIEPMPSQMSDTAMMAYIQAPGAVADMGIRPLEALGDSTDPKNVIGTATAQRQPMTIVKIPNRTSPIERS